LMNDRRTTLNSNYLRDISGHLPLFDNRLVTYSNRW